MARSRKKMERVLFYAALAFFVTSLGAFLMGGWQCQHARDRAVVPFLERIEKRFKIRYRPGEDLTLLQRAGGGYYDGDVPAAERRSIAAGLRSRLRLSWHSRAKAAAWISVGCVFMLAAAIFNGAYNGLLHGVVPVVRLLVKQAIRPAGIGLLIIGAVFGPAFLVLYWFPPMDFCWTFSLLLKPAFTILGMVLVGLPLGPAEWATEAVAKRAERKHPRLVACFSLSVNCLILLLLIAIVAGSLLYVRLAYVSAFCGGYHTDLSYVDRNRSTYGLPNGYAYRREPESAFSDCLTGICVAWGAFWTGILMSGCAVLKLIFSSTEPWRNESWRDLIRRRRRS